MRTEAERGTPTVKKGSLAKLNGHAEPVPTLASKAPEKMMPVVNESVEEMAIVGVVMTDESSTPGAHVVVATAKTPDRATYLSINFRGSGCVYM